MGQYYILNGTTPVPVDLFEWAEWFETADRIVGKTNLNGIEVSTVFTGLGHQFGKGLPLLFETIVFGGVFDGVQDRYCTWGEAVAGHKAMVDRVVKSSRKYK